MRIQRIPQVVVIASFAFALGASAAPNDKPAELPAKVEFEVGDTDFAPGDSIDIQQVRGTNPTIQPGDTISVEGTYALASQDKADLGLFVTTTSSIGSKIDPAQMQAVEKGNGTFRLLITMREAGYPHISFYSASDRNSFGGVYFGQGASVLKNKGWAHGSSKPRGVDSVAGVAPGKAVSTTGPNAVLLEYLGEPVPVPADMDAAYTKEGLTKAVEKAAVAAGVTLKHIEIDTSEFPFLIGLVAEQGVLSNLMENFRKMSPTYGYSGSVSSNDVAALNIVPYEAFPPAASQRISRRMNIRSQVLFDKLLSQR